MFTERTNWIAAPCLLTPALAARRRRGLPVLDLTETNPTRVGFGYLDAAPERELGQPQARAYDPDPRGLPAARNAVCSYYEARGQRVDPAQVLLTAGTSEAYAHLFRLLLGPGDAVLVPSPSYPLLDVLARLQDVRLVPYPLHYDGRWWMDMDGLREACQAPCRAIVVISPNNPTGSVLKDAERVALVAFARERGLALIADEVFADYRLGGVPHDGGSLADETGALTFTLNGVSKLLGLPQMKLAWTVVSGPPALRDEALRRLEVIADAYLSVGTPVQLALEAWLARGAVARDEIRARVRVNLAAAREVLKEAEVLHLEGGWTAVLRVPRTGTDDALALRLLEEDGVLVDPGVLYGFPPEGFLVISLLPPTETLREGLRRLEARVSRERG